MIRSLLISATLVIVSTLTFGQSQSGANNGNRSATPSGTQETIAGCLTGGNGNYRLVDEHGYRRMLLGDNSELSQHVGQQVELTGKLELQPDASESANNGMGRERRFFQVQSVKEVSDSCTNK